MSQPARVDASEVLPIKSTIATQSSPPLPVPQTPTGPQPTPASLPPSSEAQLRLNGEVSSSPSDINTQSGSSTLPSPPPQPHHQSNVADFSSIVATPPPQPNLTSAATGQEAQVEAPVNVATEPVAEAAAAAEPVAIVSAASGTTEGTTGVPPPLPTTSDVPGAPVPSHVSLPSAGPPTSATAVSGQILSPVNIDGQAVGEPQLVQASGPSAMDVDPPVPVSSAAAEPLSAVAALPSIGSSTSAAPSSPSAPQSSAEPVSIAVPPLNAQAVDVLASASPVPASIPASLPSSTGEGSATITVEPLLSQAASSVAAPADSVAAPISAPNDAGASTTRPGDPVVEEPPAKRPRFDEAIHTNGGASSGASADSAGTIQLTKEQVKSAQNILKSLKQRPEAPAFLQPVDPVALNIPQYRTIVTEPMDLGTVDIKLAITAAHIKAQATGAHPDTIKPTEKVKAARQWGLDPSKDVYLTSDQWENDVRRVFSNCRKFNGPEHPVSKSADLLEKQFEKHIASVAQQHAALASTPVEPTNGVDVFAEKKQRRPSNPVPTIRRSSDDAGGRPKREIHPPAPKDLYYLDDPQSAAGGRGGSGTKRKKSHTSLAEQAYYDKVRRDELKFCEKLVADLYSTSNSAVAWVFYDLVDRSLDFAPAYYATIKKPISLRQVQAKLKQSQYSNKNEFDSDMELLFRNCFSFNPPGTDVYVMGERFRDLYREKMKAMPKAAPFEPEDDSDDEDDEESAKQKEAIRQQIEALQANLAQLESGGSGKNQKMIASTKASLSAMQGMTKSRSSGSKKASASKKPKKEKSSKDKKSSGTKARKASISGGRSGGAGSDEEVRVVTYEQKEELARMITELPDERLDGALRIISEDKPANANDEEEIELDIDDLSPRTLYRLYKYVVRPKSKKQVAAETAALNAKKRKGHEKKKATGGVKRKNLDETQEAARIARLQEKLQQFENAGGEGSSSAQQASSGAHDDLVQSDSSGSEESDSDEESDF